MTTMWGADPDELDLLAARLSQGAQSFDQIRTNVGGLLGTADWHGPDADRARSDWQSRHAPSLLAAAVQFREMATSLQRSAELQRHAGAASGVPITGSPMHGGQGRRGESKFGGWISIPGLPGKFFDPGVATLVPGAESLLARLNSGWSKSGTAGRTVGPERAWYGSTNIGGIPASGSVSAFTTASWKATGSASVSAHGANAAGSIGAGVQAGVSAQGKVGDQYVNAHVQGVAEVVAEANASGSAHVGTGGASAHVQGSAFVGGEATASVHADVLGVHAGAAGEVQAGIGVTGSAGGSLTATDIGFDVHGSAAFGIGAGATLDIRVDPAEVLHDLQSFHLIGSGFPF